MRPAIDRRKLDQMLLASRDIAGTPLKTGKSPVYMQSWFTNIAERNDNTTKVVVIEDGQVAGSLTIVTSPSHAVATVTARTN